MAHSRKRARQATIADLNAVVTLHSGPAGHTRSQLEQLKQVLQRTRSENEVLGALRELSVLHLSSEDFRRSGIGPIVRAYAHDRCDSDTASMPRACRVASQLLKQWQKAVAHERRAAAKAQKTQSGTIARETAHSKIADALCCTCAASGAKSQSVQEIARLVEWSLHDAASKSGSQQQADLNSGNDSPYPSRVEHVCNAIRNNSSLRSALLCGDNEAHAAICSNRQDIAQQSFLSP